MSRRMDTKSVFAFATKLTSVWLHGYHDGYEARPNNIEIVRRSGRHSLLGDVYKHGYEAGEEDVADEGRWTDVEDLAD